MKNLFIALLCFGIIIIIYVFDKTLIKDPFGFLFIILLFGVGGYNFGVGFGEFENNKK